MMVAEVFGKLHKNVLWDIETLGCSESFRQLNFEPMQILTKVGVASRMMPSYQMTRDGFTMLAMGFTGSTAASFKERYISAFNQMAEALIIYHQANPLHLLPHLGSTH